jgi:hypothetical protein
MVTLFMAWQGQTGTLIKACLDLKTSLNRVMNQSQLKLNLVKQSSNPEGLLMLDGMRMYRQGIIGEEDEEDAKYQPSGSAEN